VDDKYSQKRTLSIQQAADWIGVSRASFMGWLNRGLIPFEQLPGRGKGIQQFRRIRIADLETFCEEHYKKIRQPSTDGKKSESLTLLPR